MTKRKVIAAVVIGVLALLVATPGIQQARTAHAQGLVRHCVAVITPVSLQDIKAGKSSQVKSVTCANVTRAQAALTATNTVIEFCQDATFGNCSYDFVGSSNCSGTSVYYRQPTMPSGWDNAVSSYHTYKNCYAAALFDDPNYAMNNPGGWGTQFTSYPEAHDVSYVGPTMNDKTSSWLIGDTCHDISSCVYPGA